LHQDVVTLNGHAGGVFSVAWSPDGTRLASGSGDRTIKIWSSNGNVMRTLTGHHGQVNSVHWHPDSTRLASASYDGTVRIWDCSSGETTATLQHDGPVDTAQWSGDGRWLATANRHEPGFNSPSQVSIWSTTTWMKETQFEAASDRSDSLDWNPKDSRIAVSSHDGKVRIWKWPSPKQVHDLDGVGSVAWNHDGTRLAAGFQRGANVWDIAQSRPVTAFESGSYVAGVAWSPGGSHIAYSRHLGVTVVNVKSGAEVRQLRGHLLRVTCVDWHPHDHGIATGDVYGRIKIWNTVDQASFTPGSTVISWNSNGSRYASRIGSHVVICDRQSSQVSRWLRGHPSDVITVAWSPDIASTSYDGELWIWDATTGQVVHVLKTQLSYLGAMARLRGLLAWSSDGTRLAYAEDDYVVRIIDARTAEIVRDLPRDAKRLSEIAWSPDNSRIASGGEDTVIRIWNTDTGRRTNVLGSSDHEEIRVICWNPNGSRIACATADNTISLWDVATGQRPHRLVGHVNYVHTVSWSPDGRRIASGDQAGKIRIWDAVTGHETLTLTYPSAVSKVAWNPDGKCLAAVEFGEENVRHWVLSEKSSGPGHW
jgi:WD40 repeat protein